MFFRANWEGSPKKVFSFFSAAHVWRVFTVLFTPRQSSFAKRILQKPIMSREPDDDDRLVLPAGDRTREWRKEEEKGVYLLLPLLPSLPPSRGPGPIITGLSRGRRGEKMGSTVGGAGLGRREAAAMCHGGSRGVGGWGADMRKNGWRAEGGARWPGA